MKIEKLGLVITAGTGSAETVIKVTPDQFELNGAARCRAEIEELRDALTAALAEYDTLTAATEQPAPTASAFTVGQVLTGDEDLPVGTVVQDSDWRGADTWTFEGDQWVTPYGDYASAQHWPGTVERYGPVKIVSLP